MADEVGSAKLVKVSSSRVRKCKVKFSNNKNKRNRNRNLRRKKSKLKYIERIRTLRANKESQSLCNSLAVFNVTDMNSEHDNTLLPPKEVSNWQFYHQLAYWKSRAVSLEYENQMLHAHIEKICTQQVQDYVDYIKGNKDERGTIDNGATNSSSEFETGESSMKMGNEDTEDVRVDKKVLYGDKESKINAMETAMKVNYNLQLERHKPQLWPNIPLNL